MRKYIRARYTGATYFFTLTLQDRASTMLLDHVDLLRESMRGVHERHPFTIDAIAILPDHLHALWTLPEGDGDYAKRWMLIKQSFTRLLRQRGMAIATRGDKGERQLWQRRYWEHLIRDEQDFAAHVEYIHFNPVKHGHAARARDWPYSSFHRYVRRGLVEEDWGVAVEGSGGRFGE